MPLRSRCAQMCPVTRCPLFSGLYKGFFCSTNIVVFLMQWKYACVNRVLSVSGTVCLSPLQCYSLFDPEEFATMALLLSALKTMADV